MTTEDKTEDHKNWENCFVLQCAKVICTHSHTDSSWSCR